MYCTIEEVAKRTANKDEITNAQVAAYFYERAARWFLSAGVFIIVLLMPYHAFLTTWLGTAVGPYLVWKSWKELLMAAMVVAVVILATIKPKLAKQFLSRTLVKFILLYAAFFIFLALVFQNPLEPTAAGLLFNLGFLALFLLAQLIVFLWPKRGENLSRWLTIGLLISTAIVSFIAILQVTVLPSDFLSNFGYEKGATIAPSITIDAQTGALRAFSTLDGPNPFGMFLLLPLSILAVYIVRRKNLNLTIPLFILGSLALFLTSSRSAWLGAIAAAALLSALLLGRERLQKYIRRYGLGVLVAVVLFGIASATYAPLRLAVFHSSPGDPSLFEGSTANHFFATVGGAVDAVNNPLGRGPGQAGPASFYAETGRIAENYYVQIAQEGGFLALILFLIILFLVGKKLWRMANRPNAPPLVLGLLASFAGIAVINLFLHGWADDPVALTWWGLAGLTLTINNKNNG